MLGTVWPTHMAEGKKNHLMRSFRACCLPSLIKSHFGSCVQSMARLFSVKLVLLGMLSGGLGRKTCRECARMLLFNGLGEGFVSWRCVFLTCFLLIPRRVQTPT
jgi:cyanate permease